MSDINSVISADEALSHFSSRAVLQAAHNELLKRYRQYDTSAPAEISELLPAIRMFIQQGQATGALLYDDDDRQASQRMLNYWVTVVARCGEEPPDATLSAFDPTLSPALPDDLCPYLGLEAFQSKTHALFFGRQRVVEHLLDTLKEHRLLAVVGPSGSGKSSVVLAGLLPMLEAGALAEGQGWHYYGPMVPGSNPLANLARLLCPPGANTADWVTTQVERLQESWDHLLYLVTERSPQPAVLVIDQFEELFTLCTEARLREDFTANLVRFIQSAGPPHRVILTMRSDFEPYLMQLPAIQPFVAEGQVRVTPLSAEELREAIEKPAERVGLRFERGIVEDLVKEILGEPAGLPLLQFTLLKLWETREGNRVTREAYRHLGGARLALARSADEFYQGLIPQDQSAVKRVLLRLVRPSEAFTFTSNRVRVEELYPLGEDPENVKRVVDRLIKARLIRQTPGETADDDQVEVAHEALVRNWPTLVDWLEDEREHLRRRLRLSEAAGAWKRSQEDPSFLWQGRQLTEAAAYRDLNRLESEFVQASQAAMKATERAQEEVRQREIAQAQAIAEGEKRTAAAQRQRADEQSKANRSLQQLAWMLATVSLVAVVLAVSVGVLGWKAWRRGQQATLAWKEAEVARQSAEVARQSADIERKKAEEQKRLATAREFAATAKTVSGKQPTFGLLLALESVLETNRPDRIVTREAELALHETVQGFDATFSLAGHSGAVNGVAFNHDGTLLATASEDGTVKVWDGESHHPVRTLDGQGVPIWGVAWSPDGTRLAMASEDGIARVWRVETSQPRQALVRSMAGGGSAGVPFAPGQHPRLLTGHTGAVLGVAFSPDGKRLATVSGDRTARVWDAETGFQLRVLTGHAAPIRGVAFSPDVTIPRLATGSEDGTARVWDAQSGEALFPLLGHTDKVIAVAFSPDLGSPRLATASLDKTARIWDARTGKELFKLSGHAAPVLGVAFSPDGKRLATVSVDTTARVWDALTGTLLGGSSGRPGHVAPVTGIAFSPDGKRLATASADKTAKVWEAESGVELFSLPSHVAIGINFGLNKSHLITATRDRKVVRIWDTTTKQPLPPLPGLNGQPIYTDRDIAAALSPDGSHLATANEDGTTKVWNASTGKRLYTLEGHTAPVMTAAFSQDGNRLATGSADRTARVWDTKSGKQLFDLSDHEGAVIAIAFSPDRSSSRLVTASEDEEKGTIRIWDMITGEQQHSISHQGGPILAVALSADGTRLATASADTMVRILDVTTTQLLYTLPGHGGPIRAIAFNADATHLIAASAEGVVRTYPLKIDDLLMTALKYLCERPMPVHEHMDRQLKGRYLDLCPHYP